MATDQEQLDAVQTAIMEILSRGQAFDVNSRRLTRADLDTLYRREAVLMRRIARASRGGIRVRRVVPVD